MTRLVAPNVREFELFEEVVEAKRGLRKTRLRNISASVKARYEEYTNNTADFSRLSASTLGMLRRKDCIHCYTTPTAALGKIKDAVLNAIPKNRNFFCQYCLISELDAIDHFVPKEKFPEYSVLAKNLVPCCPKCNRLKGAAWPAVGPAVFNLYYDTLPNEPYLGVTVTFDSSGIPLVEFSITRVNGINGPMFSRIERHFKRLHLIRRYNAAGVDAIDTYKEICAENYFTDTNDLAEHLSSEAAGLEARHGMNYWKALIARVLSESDEFLDLVLA